MSLSSSIYEHLTGAFRAMGFYIFRCECGHQWAMPATDPRLWIDGEVANVRWADPRMSCPKCGKSVVSNDDMWCPDPADEKDRKMKAWVEKTQPPWIAGVFPPRSWAILPEGLVKLHVRMRTHTVHTPGSTSCDMTTYSLFDGLGRQYINSHIVAGTLIREDGVICWWLYDPEAATRVSVDYTEAVEYFRSDEESNGDWVRVEESPGKEPKR